LLSTRPNLIPEDFVEEFKKFHDNVTPLPYSALKQVLEEDLGSRFETVFAQVDETPIAAASIAQVHGATLRAGEQVVIKILRPGIIEVIQRDLGVLYTLAGLLEKYVPETKPFNPRAMVDEFFKTLELETNFLVEANNINRISHNFKADPEIKIPHVYTEFSTARVLVLERLIGTPLSDHAGISRLDVDRERIVHAGLHAFFKMVFKHGIFHGDLHAGNLFILPSGQIGLVDFGVVGRLSRTARDAVASMLYALATEDYENLAQEYVDLAPYTPGLDFDQFSRELRDLLAPFHGMTFKNVNFGKLLMDSTRVSANHGVIMPSELMLLFKAIVTVEGMGRTILEDFDILQYANEFAAEIVRSKYDPQRVAKDLMVMAKETSSLLYSLPRQLKQLLRKVNSRDFAVDLSLREMDSLKRALEVNGNLTYLGTVVGSLVIAGALMINIQKGPMLGDFPVVSLTAFGLAFFLSLLAFYNYIRK